MVAIVQIIVLLSSIAIANWLLAYLWVYGKDLSLMRPLPSNKNFNSSHFSKYAITYRGKGRYCEESDSFPVLSWAVLSAEWRNSINCWITQKIRVVCSHFLCHSIVTQGFQICFISLWMFFYISLISASLVTFAFYWSVASFSPMCETYILAPFGY